MKKHLATFVLLASLATTALAEDAIRTNSGHTMTAGTFGLAYIDPQGAILVYDGTEAPKPPAGNPKAVCLTAADVTGDGKHELAFLSPERRSLVYYDFVAGKSSGPYGSNVTDISAVKYGKEDSFDSIVAGTFARVSYRWDVEIGGTHWQELPGDLDLVATGEFDARNRIQEVATVTRGELYTFNPQWSTYKQGLIGADCRLLTAGEMTASEGDEIVVACGDDHQLTLIERRRKTALGRSGIKLAVGKTDAGAVLCTITPEGKIQQFHPGDDAWEDHLGGNAWRDVLLADIDGNGNDEVYALPKGDAGTLQRFDPGIGGFDAVQ